MPQARLFGSGVELDEKSRLPSQKMLALAASLACLAERESVLKSIFVTKQVNGGGVYSVLMRWKSEIKEVVVDEFVPIDEDGKECFCPAVSSGL